MSKQVILKQIYQYAAVYQPDEGDSEIIVSPVLCLASNPSVVYAIASRAIPDAYATRLDNIRVIVRNFEGS